MAIKDGAGLHLCQQFICFNPAKLPTPAQWVTIERIRVKDSFTHVWWFGATARPYANNRNVLVEYSPAMRRLLRTGKYNSGLRPSQHNISDKSFLVDNQGAIPSNVLTIANTRNKDGYLTSCQTHGIQPHPARMPVELAKFFVKLCTKPRNLVFDPFGGSNVTGFAAECLKRRWVVTEPTQEYVAGSIARFSQTKR